MSTLPDIKPEMHALFRRLGEIDWDFTAQASDSLFSSIHWHPCRFPSQIPALAIGRLTKSGDLVLDPFMGSATTLVEAQRLQRNSFGIDINPVSCQLGQAKTLTEGASAILAAVSSLKLKIRSSWDDLPLAKLPRTVQGEKWYMPSTLDGLRKLWAVSRESQGIQGIIARACFSAILLSACREDRHWGYVCDNTRPKSSRAPDPRELFFAVLDRVVAAYHDRSQDPGLKIPQAHIVNGDAKAVMSEMDSDTVDCVVTSPPYFGVTDYVKAQRLTMEWLAEDIEPIRRREIGARSKRHRLVALDEYFEELDLAFQEVYRVMKPGAVAVIVFGQSPLRPDAQTRFTENLKGCGFVIQIERQRQIAVGRRQRPSLVKETVFVVRK